eukprot:jgi/Tetstr1/449165/TSEL_036374.t1
MATRFSDSAALWLGVGLAVGCCATCSLRGWLAVSGCGDGSLLKRAMDALRGGKVTGSSSGGQDLAPPPSPARRHTAVDGSPMRAYALRVTPGAELKAALMAFVKEHDLQAAAVVTCVGSLTGATLRLANADRDSGDNDVVTRTERFEILSLVGTLSATHGCHLHCSLGDAQGAVFGGHCVGGMTVFTTAEVVLAECAGMAFERHLDERTGFKELCVLCGPAEF